MTEKVFFSQTLLKKQIKLFGLSHLDSIHFECIYPEILSSTKQPIIKINSIFLHSKYDPIKEASRLISTINPASPEQVIIFFGAGLGYSILEFCKKWKNKVYWIELDLQIQIQALASLDFSTFAKQIIVINTTTKLEKDLDIVNNQLSEKRLLEISQGRCNEDIIFISHRNSYRLNSEFELLQRSFESYLNRKSVNMATMGKFDRLWSHNLIRNFSVLSVARPVSLLFDLFTNASALVCGAGPSLYSDIEKIRELSKSCLLICVDTALHILESHDIEVDIVVCVDPQSINQYYLEFLKCKHALFIVEPTTSPQCLRHIPKDRLFFMQSPIQLASFLNDSFDKDIGKIAYGGSVSTNSYDLAIKMGCKNILLFGQDFSFSYKKAHSRGAILEDRLNYIENRFHRRELHNYGQLHALPIRYVNGKNGKKITSNDKLIIFFKWFENRIMQDMQKGIKVYDLKSEGARLTQANQSFNLSLPLFYCDFKVANSNTFQKEKFRNLIEACIAGLQKVKNISTEANSISLDLLTKIKSNRKNGTLQNKLRILDNLDKKLHSLESYSKIAGSVIQKVIYSITESKSEPQFVKSSKVVELDSLKKSIELYEGLYHGSSDLIVWMNKSLKQLH